MVCWKYQNVHLFHFLTGVAYARLSLRTLFKRDMYCAGSLSIAVLIFNIAYWLRWRYIEGGESCHNELELSRKNLVQCVAI